MPMSVVPVNTTWLWGERRAKAVSRFLTVQGVSSSQIETISYGEEQPAVIGHSEAAWGKNRRVELKY